VEAGPRSVRTRPALSAEEGVGAAIVVVQGDALGTGDRDSGGPGKGVPAVGCGADLTRGEGVDGTLGTANLGGLAIGRRPNCRQRQRPPRGHLRRNWWHQPVRRQPKHRWSTQPVRRSPERLQRVIGA
jgi:hypothetical protein